MRLPIHRFLVVIVLSTFLAACGNGTPQIDRKTKLKNELDANFDAVTNNIIQLSTSLETGTMTNSIVLKSYADKALKKKPEFDEIIRVLASEGTVNGPTYLSLKTRLDDAQKRMPDALITEEAARRLNSEFNNIGSAAQDYDAMLVDAINVLADFTGGELPKLRELQYEGESPSAAPVGSEYVGNSNYGEWKQGSNGNSFWAFYGQYAMFSALMRGPVSYDGWSNSRRPSYYHDYGRGAYSSPSGKANQNETLGRTKKNYSAKGKNFKSSYAKAKPTIKGAPSGTKPKFKSSYASTRKSISAVPKRSSASSSSTRSSYNSRSSSSGRSSYGGGK